MNLFELSGKFNTHDKCVEQLEKVRWNGKPICPFCKSTKITARDGMPPKSNAGRPRIHAKKPYKTPRYHCNNCKRDFTVLMGTIFEGSKLPLQKWFMLTALMLNAKKGISAMQIHRDLGITYKSAWFSAMRLRCAMLDQSELLEGIIESDAMYVGGKPRHRYKQGIEEANLSVVTTEKKREKWSKKIPVVGFVERNKLKRIVLKMFNNNPTSEELLKMLDRYINEDDATLMTDEGKEFAKFKKKVPHYTVNHSKKEYVRGKVHTNTIEGFWAMFKNGLRGQYHVLSQKYLPFYLAEFAYKYNRRTQQKTSFMETIYNAVNDKKQIVKYKPKTHTRYIAYKPKRKKAPFRKRR